MNEYEVRADLRKNRLYVVLRGYFSDDEARRVADITIREAQKLRPGFGIINDIADFKPMSQQGAEEMKRAQLFVKENGVGRVIRVVSSITIGSMQFARKSREVGYDAETASSVEEAERMLGPWWQRSVG